jgi:hypothetical protein
MQIEAKFVPICMFRLFNLYLVNERNELLHHPLVLAIEGRTIVLYDG